MNAEQWNRLSDWHNAWLDANADGRLQLRVRLTATQPDLAAHADDLLAAGSALDDFMETPAFVLAARQLAHETTSLATGADVGPYRVVSLIAHGGMGVVYRATDMRLHRDVALKMLAPFGVPDELQVERFIREARITASIDHPNVVKVYDVGVFEGQPYIVVELLEGETLRARLNRDVLTASVACQIATDIAKGLVAAHAAGLVHRDLKPENIFLTRAGITKILDFGIAKLGPEARRPHGATSTITGILLGSAGYLAPEQVRGLEVDARADLFALGSILFELITGQRAFAGEHTVDTLHAILHAEPPDLVRHADGVPDVLARIVSRLLEKSPADRFQSAADLTWALEQSGTPDSAASQPGPVRSSGRGPATARWVWLTALLALVTIVLAMWRTLGSQPLKHQPPGAPTRFTWTLPAGTSLLSAPVASPDGRRICWVGGQESGVRQVFVRDLSSLDAAVVPGTEGARHPFWSPDGQAIGFFAAGKLKRVALDGGSPIVLADAPDPRGGTWGRSGVIVFQPQFRDTSLMRVSDQGGAVKPVTAIDRGQEETAHRWPAFLPDGVHFIYSIVSLPDAHRGIYLGSLDDPPVRPIQLFTSESAAVYAPLGDGRHGALVSVANGRIEVRPFDPARRILEGAARVIGIDAVATTFQDAALLTATADVLAYSAVMVPWGSRFASVGRDGSNLQFLSDRELWGAPRLSPDGGRLVRGRVDARGNPDIWVDDLQRGTRLRLTTSADLDVLPVWSPDGRQIAYRSGTVHETTIGFAASDGTGVTRTLGCPQQPCEPSDWSPDGKYLVVTVGGRDIWTVPVEAGATPQKLLAEAFTERDARISPDGRWLAYVSDESGRPEVSVRSLAGPSRRFVVSSGGGDQPVWSHDGGELFFAAAQGALYSVFVRPDAKDGLAFGTVTRLKVPPLRERHWGTSYEVSSDSRRFYFPDLGDERPPHEFGLVLNWSALLK